MVSGTAWYRSEQRQSHGAELTDSHRRAVEKYMGSVHALSEEFLAAFRAQTEILQKLAEQVSAETAVDEQEKVPGAGRAVLHDVSGNRGQLRPRGGRTLSGPEIFNEGGR
ncbi:MAG: hypothetical protein LKG15_05515 [Corynebacterium provencense]|jgi:hypothetical protein|uniref:hypothetical protein n=1 Tax=Corynebacterium provencense TaxID=1737425 RepID=UPI002989A951|nr:hypothetical protein [Corynebacterium provencense]